MRSKPSLSALEKLRQRIEAATAELAGIPGRELPHAEAVAKATDWVDQQAARFDPVYKASVFCQPTAAQNLDLLSLDAKPQGSLLASVDTAPLLAWLHGDRLKAELKAAIEARPEAPDALAEADRGPMAAKLRSEIAKLETDEEVMARELEAAGDPIRRRDDAPIEVILAPDSELTGQPEARAA